MYSSVVGELFCLLIDTSVEFPLCHRRARGYVSYIIHSAAILGAVRGNSTDPTANGRALLRKCATFSARKAAPIRRIGKENRASDTGRLGMRIVGIARRSHERGMRRRCRGCTLFAIGHLRARGRICILRHQELFYLPGGGLAADVGLL